MMEWLIMLESMALSVIGGAGYIMYKHIKQETKDLQPIRYFSLAAIAGMLTFAALGEPSNVTAWQFVSAGFSAPVFLKEILVPWWKAD